MSGGHWYHCSLKPISRSAGRSAVACAAYRTGASLADDRYATTRDFSRKSDVVTSFTVAPDPAPAWAKDVAQLWNAVEAKEGRKDSQLAFEWEIALPASLDDKQREDLAREFSGWLVEEYGSAVTVGIHSGGDRGNSLNYHTHVMMTTRSVGAAGWGGKLRQFNTRPGAKNPEVEKVREKAAEIINDALADSGSDERVTAKSYKARGLTRVGTTHLGPAVTAYEREGYATERGDINRAIIAARIVEQEAFLPEITAELERELAARFGDPEPEPTPIDGVTAETERVNRLIEEARAGEAVAADIVEHATAEREPMPQDAATSGQTPPAAPPGWWQRMKRIAGNLWDLLQAESSGAAQPDQSEPGLFAQLMTQGIEAGKSFAERVRERGRQFWGNQRGSIPDIDPFEAMRETMETDEPENEDRLHQDYPEPDGPDLD